jgi:drug/metabolite transporter (DMT)-like permease
LEGVGVVIAFTGAMLCSKDSESSSEAADRSNAIYGDMMALASAVAGVAYLTFAKAIRSEMSVTVLIFSVMFFESFSVLAFIGADSEEGLEWTVNPYDGVFSEFSLFHGRILALLYLAVVCNMVGTMGFVRSMEYFDNVVIAVLATLMEPLLASVIAFIFHAGLLPGPLGWFGNFVVVAGTLTVVYPSLGKGGSSMH